MQVFTVRWYVIQKKKRKEKKMRYERGEEMKRRKGTNKENRKREETGEE